MSHNGEYTYNFSRIDPSWCDSTCTGVESLVIGLTCTFSGLDSNNNEVVESQYIDGVTGFEPCITFDYLNSNVQDICNGYANECNWFTDLKTRVDNSIDGPTPMTGVSFNVTPSPSD